MTNQNQTTRVVCPDGVVRTAQVYENGNVSIRYRDTRYLGTQVGHFFYPVEGSNGDFMEESGTEVLFDPRLYMKIAASQAQN